MSPAYRIVPYGSPDRRRLRIGRYRAMYDITAQSVSVWHLGRGWTEANQNQGEGIPQTGGLEFG
jgi:hypothetical protein